MSTVIYTSNEIYSSNLSMIRFGDNVVLNGNVGIGTTFPLAQFHVHSMDFQMSIELTSESKVLSYTDQQRYGLLPIGSIILISTHRLVTLLNQHGWLECDGTLYNQSSYPLLEPLLRSGNYNNGTGFNSTFRVPDLRDRIPVGGGVYSQGYYNTNSSKTFSLSVSHLPTHTHSGNTGGPDNWGSHAHTLTDVSTGWDRALETNACCGGRRTNGVETRSTDSVNGFNGSHSHGASWASYTNGSVQSIGLERNKIRMIYMIKSR